MCIRIALSVSRRLPMIARSQASPSGEGEAWPHSYPILTICILYQLGPPTAWVPEEEGSGGGDREILPSPFGNSGCVCYGPPGEIPSLHADGASASLRSAELTYMVVVWCAASSPPLSADSLLSREDTEIGTAGDE